MSNHPILADQRRATREQGDEALEVDAKPSSIAGGGQGQQLISGGKAHNGRW